MSVEGPVEGAVMQAVDSIQARLTSYACAFNYDELSIEVIHAAKVRVIDTLGALLGGGFFAEPCRIARNLAAQMPDPAGATVIGTRMKTALDMAAYVNCTAARYPELTDGYLRPGSMGGHPSDVVTSLLAAGECAHSSGRAFIASIVLGYEIFCRVSDVFHNMGFDHSTFNSLATAVAAGKLLGLAPCQVSHCISMAIVPNNILRQVKADHLSMYKAVASGHAGRAGIFAALLARAGMEGPHLPFEGKAGWCEHVALERFKLDAMGGKGTPFRILDTSIKIRPVAGTAIASVLATEKLAPLGNRNVKQVIVEVFERAVDRNARDDKQWNPVSREDADHSLPYIVAATLMDGTITLRTFDDRHLRNPELRALMQKIEVIENEDFTKAFKRLPQIHRARITVVTESGERLVGEAGGDEDDFASRKQDARIEEKFRALTEELLGSKRVNTILGRLWHLDDLDDVSEIPPACVLV